MITVNHLTVDFGKRLLFDDVSFVIGDKERVALVGKNGAGKTTLLKKLAGEEQPTSGTLSKNRELTIGYLPQVMLFRDHQTLWEEAESVFANLKATKSQLDQIVQEMETRTDHESESYLQLLNRYTELNDQLLLHSYGSYEAEIERTLLGLGFEREDFGRETSEFSGGWRMRIELAKILLARPSLLLLDEPTNHLDIESIEWLERYIQSSSAALVLVSHDQTFLDATTSRTLEIELGKLYDYKVCYSDYIALREERLETQRRAYENQQKLIADTEAFIERFRYKATKAIQVQSRIKQLEKLDLIEIEEIDRKKIHFQFPIASRSGDYPLIVEDLSKSFGDKKVFSGVSLTLHRGDKVAFLGKNGSGKTTLLRCIMGQLTDYTGTLKLGHNVSISYFSQNRAQELDPKLSIRETVDRAATGDIRTHIEDMLGAFMFGGETADKPVSVLSGGERSRLAVLLLLLCPSNFLILDEPTNHLDIRSKEVLKEAIKEFPATVILVSHDRHFLEGLVDKVYEFEKGKVLEHLGGMEEYLQKWHEKLLNETSATSNPKAQSTQNEVATLINQGKLDYLENKKTQKKIRSLKNSFQETESKVEQLEKELRLIEDEIASRKAIPAEDPIYKQHQEVAHALEQAMEKWEQLGEELQEAEQKA